MFTEQKYREMAVHCRVLARDLDDQSKASLETLAREYDDGAARAERAAQTGVIKRPASAELERVK